MTALALRVPRLPRGVAPAAVLALVALVAALLGALGVRTALAPHPSAAVARMPVLRSVGLEVFGRRQSATDRRDAPRSGDFRASSIRRLAIMPNVPSVLSTAKDAAGDICLVNTVMQGRQYSAACVTPAVFAQHGIALQWSLSGWSAGEPYVDEGYLPRFFVVVWAPDGTVRYRTHVVGQG